MYTRKQYHEQQKLATLDREEKEKHYRMMLEIEAENQRVRDNEIRYRVVVMKKLIGDE